MVLEACIVVPLFLFFVLTMYGLLTVFMAQNLIGHALLESTQSLALDAYATDQFTGNPSVGEWVQNLGQTLFGTAADDPSFSNEERWYDREKGATQADWEKAARARFVGYLAGGDEEKAQAILEALRVTDGLDGLDFSGSTLRGSDLTIRVDYEITFFFNPFDLAKFSTSQQAGARMWGAKLIEEEE